MKKALFFTVALCLSVGLSQAQDKINSIPLIGSKAPSFKASTTQGDLNFPKDLGESWKILFSHPKDFTPVCSSELLEMAYQQDAFNDLNARFVVISTDNLDSHNHWKAALEEIDFKKRGAVKIDFPLVDDHQYKISSSYGMIHADVSIEQNIRGVFFIDPDNIVRAIYFYPMEVGRSLDELKRTLIALQKTSDGNSALTPANWNPGDDLMVSSLTDDETVRLNEPESDIYQVSWFMTYMKEEE